MSADDVHRDEDGTALVKVLVGYVDAGVESTERLWAKALGGALYEIRSTPWFLYGINWGDTVRCAELSNEEVPRVLGVERTSGHRTLRVMFNEGRVDREDQERILSRLTAMDAFHERYNDRLLAIDVEPQADYDAVFDFLARCTEDDSLIFEEAWHANDDGSFGPTYEDTQPDPNWDDTDK